jgi:hypothetical protein
MVITTSILITITMTLPCNILDTLVEALCGSGDEERCCDWDDQGKAEWWLLSRAMVSGRDEQMGKGDGYGDVFSGTMRLSPGNKMGDLQVSCLRILPGSITLMLRPSCQFEMTPYCLHPGA